LIGLLTVVLLVKAVQLCQLVADCRREPLGSRCILADGFEALKPVPEALNEGGPALGDKVLGVGALAARSLRSWGRYPERFTCGSSTCQTADEYCYTVRIGDGYQPPICKPLPAACEDSPRAGVPARPCRRTCASRSRRQ
jgi:hypothetical protein